MSAPPVNVSPTELGPVLPALLEALGHAGIGVVLVADRDGNAGAELQMWYANEPAAQLLGYTPTELRAQAVADTIIPAQRPLLAQLVQSFRAGQPVPPALELTLLHRGGNHVPTELAIGRYELDDGAVYVVVIRGIATQQQMQISLLEADRITLIGALAAGVAHEINNPLTSVLLTQRSLRKVLTTQLTEPVRATALRYVDDITTGAERIASHTRALQTLASRGEIQPCDLAAIVSSALRLAAPTLQPHANVVRQIFAVRMVAGEPSRLGQAVLAMLLFSRSGFDHGGGLADNRIVVTVEDRGELVVVEVADNGHELIPAEAVRAFDPFFRSSLRGAGLGVGLGVARSVATQLGGEVTLAPGEGGGAVVTMRLPTVPAASPVAPPGLP